MSEGPTGNRKYINESAIDEWVSETSPFERIHTVLRRSYEPQSVGETARRARVDKQTARRHLQHLVDSGVVTKVEAPANSECGYRRSPESIILEHATQLREKLDRDELLNCIVELEAELNTIRTANDSDSPKVGGLDGQPEIDRSRLLKFKTGKRNLALAKATLALDEAISNIG